MIKQFLILFTLLISTLLFLEFGIQGDFRWAFPPPSSIFLRMWEIRSLLFSNLLVTLLEMGLGLLGAFLSAFPLAWMMWRSKSIRLLFQPLFVIIQCIPIITLAPLLILWFGWGLTAIVIPCGLMIFFPLTMTLYKGLQATPKGLVDLFLVHQATSWQTFIKLQLPSSFPYLLAGLRISCAIATVAAVCGEWVGGQKGLGVLMLESKRAYDLHTTFAALTTIILLSLALYGATLLLEFFVGKRYQLGAYHYV